MVQLRQASKNGLIGGPGAAPSLSGLQEPDYPSGSSLVGQGQPQGGGVLDQDQSISLQQRSSMHKVPLPAELVEHFGHMQANCMIGLFPEIERAWLTIDSDIYVWRFEDCQDLAYFDGLSDTILSVGLLIPKPGIFKPHVKYLLCLTTAVEIVLLGVVFNTDSTESMGFAEMQVLPDPLFTLSTDSTHMLCVKGSPHGRIFLGGKDGCLYEFAYKAEDGWFGKKAQKINHSTAAFSFLVPTFINSAFSEEDPLVQLEIDHTRNILYSRSEKGSIQVFDLGTDGMQLNRVAVLTQQSIVKEACKVALNIDKSNFSPIIGISAIKSTESSHLGVVAVTAGGVRLYFTTTTHNVTERPSTLVLQHIRLPPGFAHSSFPTAGRPSKVHMSYYKNGTLLLSCSQHGSSDQLWILSGDYFPLDNRLMEGTSTLPIEGRVWALEEIPFAGKLDKLYRESFGSMESPLLAVQHMGVSRRFVIISAQGTHIVSKLRPADHLRQLMIEHGGPDNAAVKNFFRLFGPNESIAICLILACSQAVVDSQTAEWATRAFFMYGGTPCVMYHQQTMQGGPQSPANSIMSPVDSFHPNIASTPAPHNIQQFVQPNVFVGHGPNATTNINQPVSFSGKHNGLYLYFSRLVRPVWLKTLVLPTSSKDIPMTSSVASEEIDWINAKLLELKAFLEKNAQYLASAPQEGPNKQYANQQHDAFLRERQSLMFLQQLLWHTVQVLGLWKIVCIEQFHAVASKHLSQDDQNIIKGMYFRDLIMSVSGREMCGSLVHGVIGRYLADNARTDAISSRLRDACPSLYDADDAVSSKAHEMIISAKQEANLATKQKMISDAVALCKKVAGRLNLEILVSHLVAVHAYVGVVEICLAAAQRRDPQGLALHYYKNGEPAEDHQGLQAFVARTSAYKHVTYMLRRLLDASNIASIPNTATKIPLSPGAPSSGASNQEGVNQLAPQDAVSHADQVFNIAIKSDDELFHVELYQWMLSEKMYERLLGIRGSIYLEDFLTRGTSQHPDNLAMFDLLWKYYEKNNSYVAAAKILARLADRHSTEIDLKQRIEYLSRAIIAIKSDEVGVLDSHRHSGAGLLNELEEKMEVARVQLSLMEAIRNMHQTPETSEAIVRLNSDLMDITRLYSDFAEPYGLWECQLAILHCAQHSDGMLIETVWDQIINNEINNTDSMMPHERINVIANKIKTLGKLYYTSQKFFPMGKIVSIFFEIMV